MMKIEKLLMNCQDICNYKINTKEVESTELFFALDRLETIRKTKTKDVKATLYVKNGDRLGEASFSVLNSDNEEALKEKIQNTIANARLINNEYYELPKDEHLVKTLKSNIKNYSGLVLGKMIYEAIKEEIQKSEAQINALEIFINKIITSVINGSNTNKKVTSFDIFVEAIPTKDKGEDSFELYQALEFSIFDKDKLQAEIKEQLDAVNCRSEAIIPDFKIDAPVVINKNELRNLFDEYVYNLNYALKYNHSNILNVGDKIQDGGDLVTIEAVAGIKGSSQSLLFDSDGVSLKDKLLVKDGTVCGMFGSGRYCQYLNEEITGNLPCFKVGKGTLNEETIKKMPYFECLSFSGIQVDLLADYIGGEVRLAKYFDGEKVTYITGVSISGSLRAVMNEIRLSNKLALCEEYYGPNKAMLKTEIL